MSTGWKKWECPPDMFSVEQKLGTLQLTDDQTDRMALAYFEVEMKRAKDNDLRQKWAAQYVKTQAKIIKKDLKEAFVEDFQLWLQGRSKYCQPTIKVPVKQRDGGTEIVTRTATPWGNKGLLHLPEVCDWLKKPVLNRDKVIKKVAELQLGPLRTIDECWLYYKYITRAVAVDGDIIKEQREFNVFDYLEQRPLKLNKVTGEMEEDERYKPMQIKNPSMPRFDKERYDMTVAACTGWAAAGRADVLRTPEYNDLMPGDKILILSVLAEKAGGVTDIGPAKTALTAYYTDLLERAGVEEDAPTPPIGTSHSSISSERDYETEEEEEEEPIVKKIKKDATKKFPDLSDTIKKAKEVVDYLSIPETATEITDKVLDSKKKETLEKVAEIKKDIAASFEEWKADPKAKKNKDAIFGLFGNLKKHLDEYRTITGHLYTVPRPEVYDPVNERFYDRNMFDLIENKHEKYPSDILWDEIIDTNKGHEELKNVPLSRIVTEIYLSDFMLNFTNMTYDDEKYETTTQIIDKLMNDMPLPTQYKARILEEMKVLKDKSALFGGIAISIDPDNKRDKNEGVDTLALLAQATLDSRWGRQAFYRIRDNDTLFGSRNAFLGTAASEAEWVLDADEIISNYFLKRKSQKNALPEFLELEGPLRKRLFLNSIFKGREDHIKMYYPNLAHDELNQMIEAIAGKPPIPIRSDTFAFRDFKDTSIRTLEEITKAGELFTDEENEKLFNEVLPKKMKYLEQIMASPPSEVIRNIENHLTTMNAHLLEGKYTLKMLLDGIEAGRETEEEEEEKEKTEEIEEEEEEEKVIADAVTLEEIEELEDEDRLVDAELGGSLEGSVGKEPEPELPMPDPYDPDLYVFEEGFWDEREGDKPYTPPTKDFTDLNKELADIIARGEISSGSDPELEKIKRGLEKAKRFYKNDDIRDTPTYEAGKHPYFERDRDMKRLERELEEAIIMDEKEGREEKEKRWKEREERHALKKKLAEIISSMNEDDKEAEREMDDLRREIERNQNQIKLENAKHKKMVERNRAELYRFELEHHKQLLEGEKENHQKILEEEKRRGENKFREEVSQKREVLEHIKKLEREKALYNKEIARIKSIAEKEAIARTKKNAELKTKNAELKSAQDAAYALHHQLEDARAHINKIQNESYPKEEVDKYVEQVKNIESEAKKAKDRADKLEERFKIGEKQFNAAVEEAKKKKEQLDKLNEALKRKETEHLMKNKEQVEKTLRLSIDPMEEFLDMPRDRPFSIVEEYRFDKARKNLRTVFDTHSKITGKKIHEHLGEAHSMGVKNVDIAVKKLTDIENLIARERENENRNPVKQYLQREAIEAAKTGRQMNMDEIAGIMGEEDVLKWVGDAMTLRNKRIEERDKLEREAQVNQFVLSLANTANDIDKREAITKLEIVLSDPANQEFLRKEELTSNLARIAQSISGLHKSRRENDLEKRIIMEKYKKMEEYSEALKKQLVISRENALKEGIDLETQHLETGFANFMSEYSSGKLTYENAKRVSQERSDQINEYLSRLQEQGDHLNRDRRKLEETMKVEGEEAVNLARGIEEYNKALNSGQPLTDAQKRQGEIMVERHKQIIENLFLYNKELSDIKSRFLKINLKYDTMNNIALAYKFTFAQQAIVPAGGASIPARQAIGYVEAETRRKIFEDAYNTFEKFQGILDVKKNIYRFSTTHLKGAAASLRSIEKNIMKFKDDFSDLESTFANNIHNTAMALEQLADTPLEERHRRYPRKEAEEADEEMGEEEKKRMVKEGKKTGDFAKAPIVQRAEALRAEALIRLIRINTGRNQETQLSEKEKAIIKKYQSTYGKSAKEKLPERPIIRMIPNNKQRREESKKNIAEDRLQLAIYQYSKEVESGGFNPQTNPLLAIMGGNLVQGPEMSKDAQSTAKTVAAITAVHGGVDKLVRNLSNMLGDEAEANPQTERLVEIAEKLPEMTREVLERGYVLRDKNLPPLLESGYQEVVERTQDTINIANTINPEVVAQRRQTIEEMHGSGFKDTEKYMDTLREFGKSTLSDPKREDYAAFMDGYAYDMAQGFAEDPKYFTNEVFYKKFMSGYTGSKKMQVDNLLKNAHAGMEMLGDSKEPDLVREASRTVGELLSFVGNGINGLKDRGDSEDAVAFEKIADSATTDLELMDALRSVMVTQGTRPYPSSRKTINEELGVNPQEVLKRMALSVMYKGYRVNKASKELDKKMKETEASVRRSKIRKTGRVVPYNLRSLNKNSKK